MVDAPSFMYVETSITPREIPKMAKIKAGIMFIVPHYENGEVQLPEFTILLSGQSLSRELYPALSTIFSNTGGFYDFIVPDLEGKFLLGFDDEGNPMMGSGAIFYQDVPPKLFQVRDIR